MLRAPFPRVQCINKHRDRIYPLTVIKLSVAYLSIHRLYCKQRKTKTAVASQVLDFFFSDAAATDTAAIVRRHHHRHFIQIIITIQ